MEKAPSNTGSQPSARIGVKNCRFNWGMHSSCTMKMMATIMGSRKKALRPKTSIPSLTIQIQETPISRISMIIGVSGMAIILTNSPKLRSTIAPRWKAYHVYSKTKSRPTHFPKIRNKISNRFFPGNRESSLIYTISVGTAAAKAIRMAIHLSISTCAATPTINELPITNSTTILNS